MIDQHRLRAHHVADGDDRQVEPVGLAGGRIGRGRAGRAEAAADDVGADDEEAVGVDDLAWADQHLPPAGLAGHRVGAGDVLVAGQRMADEDGVGPRRVQLAIGLVGDLERREDARRRPASAAVRAEAHDRAGGSLASLLVFWRAHGHHRSSIRSRLAAGNKKPALPSQSRSPSANGPLATCLTWLQADRPNHHGTAPIYGPPPFASTGKLC